MGRRCRKGRRRSDVGRALLMGEHPSKYTQDWAQKYAPAVEALLALSRVTPPYMRPATEDRDGSDLLFTTGAGEPARRSNFVHRAWDGAVKEAKLEPRPTPHDLRHTSAALAIKAGAHPKAIQSRMGHASITTTLNTYG